MVLKNSYSTISKKHQKLKIKAKEEKNDRLMSEIFNPYYPNFETFKEDLIRKIEIGLKQIEEGKYISAEQGFREMEEKYSIYD